VRFFVGFGGTSRENRPRVSIFRRAISGEGVWVLIFSPPQFGHWIGGWVGFRSTRSFTLFRSWVGMLSFVPPSAWVKMGIIEERASFSTKVFMPAASSFDRMTRSLGSWLSVKVAITVRFLCIGFILLHFG